ncbi:MAG: hypothetical protein Q4D16_08275 [Eubacteriales bacterium]|nr:hypothetical protein [Eubacteriales bacterium]
MGDQSYSQNGEASDEFSKAIQEIKEHATTIVNNLNEYSWQGMEGDIIYYTDPDKNQLMKALIYPSQSEDNVYEEYYYWDEEVFFAYIWESGKEPNLYYYDEGKLIRWIDSQKVCHDNETDNSEFVKRGEKYLSKAETQLLMSKAEQNTASVAEGINSNPEYKTSFYEESKLKSKTEEVEHVLSD